MHLVNNSFSEGYVPNDLKIAMVIPLFNSGDTHLVSNYRPISLLSVSSKVYEKTTYIKFVSFINPNYILRNSQFGFMK